MFINYEGPDKKLTSKTEKVEVKKDISREKLGLLAKLTQINGSDVSSQDSVSIFNTSAMKRSNYYNDSLLIAVKYLAHRNFELKKYIESKVLFEKYAALEGFLDCHERIEWAQSHYFIGEKEEALNIYSSCVKKDVFSDENLLWLANLYLELDSLKSAKRTLDLVSPEGLKKPKGETIGRELSKRLGKQKILILE